MSKILILAAHQKGELSRVTQEMLSIACRVKPQLNISEIAVVIAGEISNNAEQTINELAHWGADKVFWENCETLNNFHLERYNFLLATLVKKESPSLVLLAATTHGKELGSTLAATLGTSYTSDCIDFKVENGEIQIKRPFYAGKAISTLSFHTPCIITMRPNVFPLGEPNRNRTTQLEKIALDFTTFSKLALKEVRQEKKELPNLSEARIIISGGRGMQAPENFKLIEELAKVLSGAVGASRMVVDLGWITHEHQVGQTGKTVSPDLYIACGISGAIQHLVGMNTSKAIVAINKDSDANIFKLATYGIVGDVFEVLPVLTEEFRKLLSEKTPA